MTKAELLVKRANLTQELRNGLDRWEKENNKSSNEFDAVATGDLKRQVVEMEADLDKIEADIAICDKRAKADELDRATNIPLYDTRKGKFIDAGDAGYSKRFFEALARGSFAGLEPETRGTTNLNFTANAPIPTFMENAVIQAMYQEGVIRKISNVQTIDSKRTISVESTLPTSQITYEVGSITPVEQSMAAQIAINPIKFTCATSLSQEWIEDAIGLSGIGSGVSWIAANIGKSLTRKMESYFATGSGVALSASAGQPQGIGYLSNTFTNNTVSGTATASHVGPTGDELLDTYFSLGAQYRPGSVWLMHDSVLKSIRKLKTASSGLEYLFKVDTTGDLREGVSGTLLGQPLFVSEWMPTLGLTASTINCVLGDFKNYMGIYDRAGIQSMIDPYSLSLSGKTNLITYMRTDSKILMETAFAVFRNKAS
jgi:HK97 family phage major capsid protein